MNPDRIMKILNNHPMHIDSMLQMAEICKMGEDSAMAAELVGDKYNNNGLEVNIINKKDNLCCVLYWIFFTSIVHKSTQSCICSFQYYSITNFNDQP